MKIPPDMPKAGYGLKPIEDKQCWMSFHPARVRFAATTEARHSSGEDPKSNTHFTCGVPNTRVVYWAITDSMLPELLTTVIDLKHRNKKYWMTSCPALVAIRNEAHATPIYSATPTPFVCLDADMLALDVLGSSIPNLAAETCRCSAMDQKSNIRFACSVPKTMHVYCALTFDAVMRQRHRSREGAFHEDSSGLALNWARP